MRPNIILIMSDDMGFSDIGCYGSEINTPQLDDLEANGLRFTQFYNTARCCPTRASLMTGLNPHQAGVGHMMNDRGPEGYTGNLSKKAVTIAEVLGQSGYRNYMTGKWHLTTEHEKDRLANKNNCPGCVEVSGASYTEIFHENEIFPLEGKSLLSAFENQAIEHEALGNMKETGPSDLENGNLSLSRALSQVL